MVFQWNPNCQETFDLFKTTLVFAPILVKVHFTKPFILDVDWSTHGVGSILSQKEGRNEHVIEYANKMFSHVHKKFHPMEGKCYAIVWGVMHFCQYFYHNHFTFKIDHIPLEWYVGRSF